MLRIWIKTIAFLRRYFYLRKLSKEGTSPESIQGLIGQLELLRPEYFELYTVEVGRSVAISLHCQNVTDFFYALNQMQEIMRVGGYFDIPLLAHKPDQTRLSLDDFLLTKKDRFPVSPLEMRDELEGYLRNFQALLYTEQGENPKLGYYLRKSSWIFHDIRTLTEALFDAVKKL